MVGRTPGDERVAADAAAVLAHLLRTRRESLDWSRDRLGRATGLSVATIRAIETGRIREPGFFTVVAIARALNLSLSQLGSSTPR